MFVEMTVRLTPLARSWLVAIVIAGLLGVGCRRDESDGADLTNVAAVRIPGEECDAQDFPGRALVRDPDHASLLARHARDALATQGIYPTVWPCSRVEGPEGW